MDAINRSHPTPKFTVPKMWNNVNRENNSGHECPPELRKSNPTKLLPPQHRHLMQHTTIRISNRYQQPMHPNARHHSTNSFLNVRPMKTANPWIRLAGALLSDPPREDAKLDQTVQSDLVINKNWKPKLNGFHRCTWNGECAVKDAKIIDLNRCTASSTVPLPLCWKLNPNKRKYPTHQHLPIY